MNRFFAFAIVAPLAFGLPGCSSLGPIFGTLFMRAVASPGGVSASRSSNPNVHCQTGSDGRTDCVEYRTSAPLRNGDPAPVGGDPYASTGASANASAVPVSAPLFLPSATNVAPPPTASSSSSASNATTTPDPSWQAPLAPAPQPLPPLAAPGR